MRQAYIEDIGDDGESHYYNHRGQEHHKTGSVATEPHRFHGIELTPMLCERSLTWDPRGFQTDITV